MIFDAMRSNLTFEDCRLLRIFLEKCTSMKVMVTSHDSSRDLSDQCDQIGWFIALWATFKACGNNYFTQIAHIIRQFLLGLEIFHFSSEIIFRQLLKTFGDFLLVTLQLSLMKINYNLTTRKK